MPDSRKKDVATQIGAFVGICWMMLQPVVFYWHVLINPRAHIPYDIESYHFPVIAFIARCVRHGWAPFWDPYTYGGMPLNADLQAQMFYPPTWFAILAGNLSGGRNLFYWVEWLDPLHMILAGLFAFLLLRRMGLCQPAAIMGATVYQLGGYFASQASHLGAISTGAWLPLCILAVYELRRRIRPRWFAVLVLAVAMSILSGSAATTVVVLGAAVMFAVALLAFREASWRLFPTLLAACCVAALIAAVQLVPLWQLTGLSIASARAAWLTAWGVPLQCLVSLVRPDYYHIFEPFTPKYTLPYNYTFLYAYCGAVPLALIFLAPFIRRSTRALMFFALTLLSAFWMLGEHTPVYEFVFEHLPRLLRGGLYAWYAMMAFCLFAGITAAIVLDHFGKRFSQSVLWIVVLFTSGDLIRTGRDRPMNSAPGSYRHSSSEYQYRDDPDALQKLHALVNVAVPSRRIDYADGWAPGILAANMFDLPTPDGSIPFMLRKMLLLRRLFSEGKSPLPPPLSERNFPVTRFDSPILKMLNVGIIGSLLEIPKDKVAQSGLEPLAPIGGLYLYRVPGTLPRFYLVPGIRRSSGEAETFQFLARSSFQPSEEAIVEGISSDRAGLATGDVHVDAYTPDRIEIGVFTAGSAFLATSEPLYPGWEATVNGAARRLLPTNGVFRGLELNAGENHVIMTYRPENLSLSAAVSILALLFTIAIGLAGDRLFPSNTAAGVVR